MKEGRSLRELFELLRPDVWRKGHPFSEDISITNEVLFNTYSSEGQREEQLSNWLQGKGNQPCLFGRVAASLRCVHFCVLTERDLLTLNDEAIAEKISIELLRWRRRSFRPTEDFSTPAFGFVLLVSSQHVANAAPDSSLQSFAQRLLELWGCPQSQEPSGLMSWETLYIRHPERQQCLRFTFSVDFFAAQGDGRWWHDHRCPGGLMFTANSIGHMKKYREWYLNMRGQQEWTLQTAMLTIDAAANTPYGKATWLRPINPGGKPLAESVACPFSQPGKFKNQLVGKDWTKYGGWLHTDHAIRPEFFAEAPEPSKEVSGREYLEDFTYLYVEGTRDHSRFVAGEEVPCEQVLGEIGSIEDWTEVVHKRPLQIRADERVPTSPEEERIAELLERGRAWQLTREEIDSLW